MTTPIPGGGPPVPPPTGPILPTGPITGTGPGDSITAADAGALSQLTSGIEGVQNVSLTPPLISIAEWFQTVETNKLNLYKAFQNNEFQDPIINMRTHDANFQIRVLFRDLSDALFLTYMSFSRNYDELKEGSDKANDTNFDGKTYQTHFNEYNTQVNSVNSAAATYNAAVTAIQVRLGAGEDWDDVKGDYALAANAYNAAVATYNTEASEFNDMRDDSITKAQAWISAVEATNQILADENIERINAGLAPVPLHPVPTINSFNIPQGAPTLPTLNANPGSLPSPLGLPVVNFILNTITPPQPIPVNDWIDGFFTPVLQSTLNSVLFFEGSREAFIRGFEETNIPNSILLLQLGRKNSDELVNEALQVAGIRNSASAGGISTMVLGLGHSQLARVFSLALIEQTISNQFEQEGLDLPNEASELFKDLLFNQLILGSIFSGVPTEFLLANAAALGELSETGLQAILAQSFANNILSQVQSGIIADSIQSAVQSSQSFASLSTAQQIQTTQILTAAANFQALSLGLAVSGNAFGDSTQFLNQGFFGLPENEFQTGNLALDALLNNAGRLREENRNILSDEIRRIVVSANVTREVERALVRNLIELFLSRSFVSVKDLKLNLTEAVLKFGLPAQVVDRLVSAGVFNFTVQSIQLRLSEELQKVGDTTVLKQEVRDLFEAFREAQNEFVATILKLDNDELKEELVNSFAEFLEEVTSPAKFLDNLLKPGETLIGVMYEGVLSESPLGISGISGANKGHIDIAV